LAAATVIFLLITLGIGLAIGDFPALQRLAQETQKSGDVRKIAAFQAEHGAATGYLNTHRLFGIGAAILTLLVNSVAVTYFIGTSRWCKEVGETYGLDGALIARGQSNKRRHFPWALLGIVTIIAIAWLGAAADPIRSIPKDNDYPNEAWVLWHFLAALGGVGVICLSFFAQASSIRTQGDLIAEIMTHVERIRRERGVGVSE